MDHTLETHGKIDILCLNAGVNPHYGPMSDIPEGWRATLKDGENWIVDDPNAAKS